MSAAFPGHVRPDESSVAPESRQQHRLRTEAIPQLDSQMEQASQSRPSREPVSGDLNSIAHANRPVDTGPSLPVKQNDRGGVQEVNKRSLDYVLRSGLAGGLAGCAAKTVVAPLDRVKILFQASNPHFAKYTGSWFGLVSAMRDIHRHEGARGLFKGHSATLLRIFPYAAIKFLAYEQIRAAVIPSRDKETPFRRLISGSLAGITSVFFTYPLELIRVRLAFETKKSSHSSLVGTFRQIYNERVRPPSGPSELAAAKSAPAAAVATAENVSSAVNKVVPRYGLSNFYRGFAPTILGMLPYAGMSFLTHDTVGDWLRSPALARYTTIPGSEQSSRSQSHKGSRRPQLTAAAELFSGALAGLVSQTCSYPLEVIRRRMQVGGAVGDGHRMSIAETAGKIWLEKGFRGFWVGLTIGYIKVVPLAATSFFVYERLKWSLGI
ncbi:coenzyme A transporter [Aspergillus clavatus NRRL 1]|uniref:Mitochondrial thiamine pyrophosphate carrier 1 n=1 Tax=Aspergillus clavatus (strain ATCC 1007 / CBS 513.65 / DSM 816 / NCTC 3887 / NRRL 1 / QM 1276 / 107) TaxID=344612 RepID=A1C808_ASPCL|nr:mitochondrial carrier protein (Leu5), putative [Aspergillus clavatus NRRL 1]EAW14529.1 mitochondrial carrier protein (Leu5), putative [Aspergillus clavatus NRRL 1]